MKHLNIILTVLTAFILISCGTESPSTQFTVYVSASPGDGGTYSRSVKGPYNKGESITLRANPTVGYRFTGWTGDINSNENPLNLTVNQDYNLTAHFKKKSFN